MSMERFKDIKVLEGYGVKLRRLTEDKIELVRKWRNDPKIQQYMVFREYITPEMQKAWFARINNEDNFYFIIEYQGKEIGLIDIKNIDYEKRMGEPGIFIYEDEYLDLDVGARASFCLVDFVWNVLNLESLHIHVLKSNKRAIQINQFVGYQLLSGQENKDVQEYILTKNVALNNAKAVRIANILRKVETL